MSDWDMGFAVPSSSGHHHNSAGDSEHHLHHHPRKRRRSKLEGVASTSKPKYSRKPNLEDPKITPPCTECGKTFRSWKALFGHMRCHPERQWRGINPPPNHRRYLPPLPALTGEDHEVAASLLMLANGGILAEARSGSSFQGDGGYECSSCTRWEEDMNHGLASLGPRLGHYCGLDLNFPPAHHKEYDSVSSSGLTLDLRLGL